MTCFYNYQAGNTFCYLHMFCEYFMFYYSAKNVNKIVAKGQIK